MWVASGAIAAAVVLFTIWSVARHLTSPFAVLCWWGAAALMMGWLILAALDRLEISRDAVWRGIAIFAGLVVVALVGDLLNRAAAAVGINFWSAFWLALLVSVLATGLIAYLVAQQQRRYR